MGSGQMLGHICAPEQTHSIRGLSGSRRMTVALADWLPLLETLSFSTVPLPNPTHVFSMSSGAHSALGSSQATGWQPCAPDLPPHSPPRLPAQLISPADSMNRCVATAAESQAIMENRPGALELTLTAGPGRPPSRQRGGRRQNGPGKRSPTQLHRGPPGAQKSTAPPNADAPADSVLWAGAWASRLLSPHIIRSCRRV